MFRNLEAKIDILLHWYKNDPSDPYYYLTGLGSGQSIFQDSLTIVNSEEIHQNLVVKGLDRCVVLVDPLKNFSV